MYMYNYFLRKRITNCHTGEVGIFPRDPQDPGLSDLPQYFLRLASTCITISYVNVLPIVILEKSREDI